MSEPVLVTQSSIPSIDEYTEEIKSIFDKKWLTNNGEKHQILEGQLKEYLGVENLTLFVNGHMALYIALESMGFPKGGEVITTPFSFASTTHAIVQNGLRPVFCDINPNDYTIDADKIEGMITDKTVAIVPVHVYGNVCAVEKIAEIAKRHNLKVIYDAAHVFGVKYMGESIAKWGDISMFSFHATKVFNTIEGGALVYSDSQLKQKLDYLKNFGIDGPEDVEAVGMNAKMNEFAAAMGICNLRHLDEEIGRRRIVFERYINRLSGANGIKLPRIQEGVTPNYAYLPVVFDKEDFGLNRDEIYDKLAENNIFARKYFYPLISDYKCYQDYYSSDDTPVAKYIAQNVLTLPIYSDLNLDIVDRICEIILER